MAGAALSLTAKMKKLDLVGTAASAIEARLKAVLNRSGPIEDADVAPLLHSLEAIQIALKDLSDDCQNHPQNWR